MPAIYIKTLIVSISLMILAPVYSQDNIGSGTSDVPANLENLDPVVLDGSGIPEQISLIPDADIQSINRIEIVVLLENSPGLPGIDIGQLLTNLTELRPETSIGLMRYGDQVFVIQSLTASNELDLDSIQDVYSDVSLDGAEIDLGRALERAIYELKYNGNEAAGKKILLIANSGVSDIETGGAGLPATVVSDISEFNITLDAVALSESTMNYLSESLNGLQNTAIHIIQDMTELDEIVDSLVSINSLDNTDQFLTSPVNEGIQEIPQIQPVQTQSQVNTRTPVASPVIGEEEQTRTVIIVISAFILIFTLGALLVLLYFRMKKLSATKNVEISEAYLKDIHGYTSNETYKLSSKATMLGRVAGKDSDNLDYIVIPETTIGRRHAVIEYKDFAYWISDQGSINGTFVNNIPIASEVRLKQGDLVRLHKFEFEFSIPELDEAGMTKISNTVLADHIPEEISLDPPEIDDVKENISSAGLDLDFGFGDTPEEPSSSQDPIPASDETLLPGHDIEDQPPGESANETLMPTSGTTDSVDVDLSAAVESEQGQEPIAGNQNVDVTLMPGYKDELDDEDETIRPNKQPSEE